MNSRTMLFAACLALSACTPPKEHKPVAETKPTVRLTLIPQAVVAPGQATPMLAKLNNIQERTVVAPDQLAVAHTEKLHLLVVDPTLTDYQHLHPQPTKIRGVYSFSFTPKLPGGYRAWADITPLATNKQEYDVTDIGQVRGKALDKSERHEAVVNGYRFALSFDQAPAVGEASMGTIKVTAPDGSAMKALEPVMGAYAHIVGFSDDLRTVVHVHPMGDEPKNAGERGGPELMFHLEPTKAGFVKLFAQVRIQGKDVFVPFGVNVAAAK